MEGTITWGDTWGDTRSLDYDSYNGYIVKGFLILVT